MRIGNGKLELIIIFLPYIDENDTPTERGNFTVVLQYSILQHPTKGAFSGAATTGVLINFSLVLWLVLLNLFIGIRIRLLNGVA